MNVSQHKVKGHNTNQMIYRGGSDIALGGAPAPSHFVTMLQHQGVTLFCQRDKDRLSVLMTCHNLGPESRQSSNVNLAR